MRRRDFLKVTALESLARPAPAAGVIEVDPTPRFELSPYLYMQFMEPLGATDGSVEAAWNHERAAWREDFIRATKKLAPTMIRWGGIFIDYYRWREAVGPREQRKPVINLMWGGIESNQVGTAELVELARTTGAELLIAVNFESDGRPRYQKALGGARTAGAEEAASWVAYCNQPGHPERLAHGFREPFGIRFWQIGNETSYSPQGFDAVTAARKTLEFARAMRAVDPEIQLIAWGDEDYGARRAGRKPGNWAQRMLEIAGDQINLLAFHHMYNPDDPEQPALAYGQFRIDPDRAWAVLMDAWKPHEAKIQRIRESLGAVKFPLALTECHYSIPGRNRGEVLSSWAAGVSYARLLNAHERHGDLLKIATAADFCGTRWQVVALMIPMPAGETFLMPVAQVMRLYRHHTGKHALAVVKAPSDLDVTASSSAGRLYLHVVNTRKDRSIQARVEVRNRAIGSGRAWEISAEPFLEIHERNASLLEPVEKPFVPGQPWSFAPASVTALELAMEPGPQTGLAFQAACS